MAENSEAETFPGPAWADQPAATDPLLQPPWTDLPDETRARAPRPRSSAGYPATDAASLLAPLAAAQDAVARLDARAEAAPAPIRVGLIGRLALREAAGYLAARQAWVHPHDLALRAANLAGRFDTAAQIARPRRALPNTLTAWPGGWDDPEDLAALAQGEAAVLRALALARLLTALPRRHDPLAGAGAASALLAPLGTGVLDGERFAAWRTSAPHPAGGGGRQTAPCPALPPLLQAADAARSWMESGITDEPDAIAALAIGALRLARSGALRAIPLPFWAAWPALGHPVQDGLPRLRPAGARALAGTERAPWPAVFLAFAAEAARAGLRELDRLEVAAEAGGKLAGMRDRRSRLPAAVALLLSAPVVTPRAVAEKLGVTPQAANRMLAVLQRAGIVREVTGRGSFRAFAV